MANTINLTDRDIDYIARVVDTEVPRSIQRRDPVVYRDMVRAVVDTVTNRLATEGYPKSVTGVLNQRRQFSKITGPSNLDPYGSVQNTPKASQAVQDLVRQHVENRTAGALSTIGGAVNYANPNVSDKSNLTGWINPMIEAGAKRLGLGQNVHYHGNAPGAMPADEYSVALNGVDNTGPLSRVPTPTFADRAGTGINQADSATGIMSAVNPASTMGVERGLLSDLPSITPTEAYGQLASTMGETPSLNLSGAGVQSPASDRMAGGMVASGLDGLRSGLLSSGSMPSQEAKLAEMQASANLQNEINQARGRVSQDRTFQAYQPEQTVNDAVGAIEAVSPTTQSQTPSLADAYAQMGQSMEMGGILGASGLKVRDPNDILGVGRLAQNPLTSPVDSLPAYEPETVQTAAIEGPVTTGVQTPEATVEQDTAVSTTPDATQAQPSKVGQFARNAGVSMLGGIAGSALGGPIGGILGSALAKEAFGAPGQNGLLDGVKGLLGGGPGGQGAWAGVGTLNDLGQGSQAAYGAWGGPQGTTGTATDGSRITNLGNGIVSRIDKFGRETLFKDGDTWGGGGGWDGGLFGGLFGGNSMGDGSRSQADRARDSVGLY
ncbi:hypothetical protein J2Y63_002396 [Shinella sp. BE166]|uniref:cell wall hydrolase n=1 Tax=Shinella sp. BE166 TaxID=3373918 RepID=UPI003EB821F5